MQIDFDKLLADDAALLKLSSAKDIKSLAGVPGLKVVAEPKVTDRVQSLRRAVTIRVHSASSGPCSTGLAARLYQ